MFIVFCSGVKEKRGDMRAEGAMSLVTVKTARSRRKVHRFGSHCVKEHDF